MKKTNNEVTKKTVLTVDELKKMGEALNSMRETIELYNHAMNLTPHVRNIGQSELAVYYHALYDLTDTMFHKNQEIVNDLDEIAYTLLDNDEAFEIENTRKKFN